MFAFFIGCVYFCTSKLQKKTMIQYTSCKINIGLNVLFKRNDNYHELSTIFYPVKFLYDAIEIVQSTDNKDFVHLSGLTMDRSFEDNLCYKAIQLLRKEYRFPYVSLYLHKVVPVGAGLGGGSADATYTLRMLNEMFDLQISNDRLQSYATLLGSDCAFFLHDSPQIGHGRGELLEPLKIDLSGFYLLIVKPDIHISTAEAYSNIVPNPDPFDLSQVEKMPISDWKNVVKNDFEDSIFNRYPEIEILKQNLYNHGAIYAQMSGSGAACFGIFENSPLPISAPDNWSQYIGIL